MPKKKKPAAKSEEAPKKFPRIVSKKSEETVLIPPKLRFYNIKSPFFRSVHADGMWGTLSPHGHLHFTFYNERSAIPQVSVHNLTPTGQLGPEIMEEREGKNGIVREMEVDVILDQAAARRLFDWLKTNLKFDEPAPPSSNG